MKPRYIVLVLAAAFISIYLLGASSGRCSTVGSCRNCWQEFPVAVKSSELCSNETCTAAPYLQQHNAVVGTLLCACDTARAGDFKDAAMAKDIEVAYAAFANHPLEAQALCSDPAKFLVRRSYG